jgi:putative restriction endonuclease
MDYIRRQADLHLFADDPTAVAALEDASARAARGAETQVDLDAVGGEGRKETIRTVIERVGQQNFRSRILAVYGHQCAVCTTQLNLLDAAHIIPVPGGGTNETRNGLSLCKIHHAAYDKGFVAVLGDYRIAVNETATRRLRLSRRDGGLQPFRDNLLPNIREPARPQDRPLAAYLEQGLILRGWQGVMGR